MNEYKKHFQPLEESNIEKVGDVFSQDLVFIVEDISEKEIKHKYLSNHDKYHLLSGAVAGAISRTFTAPFDRLKIIYQVTSNTKEIPSLKNGIKNIIVNEGIQGLFRGNLINVMKASPDTMIKFYCYERLKQYYLKLNNVSNAKDLRKENLLVAGGVSGAISNIFIYPLDVIKTNLCVISKNQEKGISQIIRSIYKSDGILGFYKGLSISLASAFPGIAINMTVYELLKGFHYDRVESKNISMIAYMVFGGTASMISATIMYPLQLIQSKVIMNRIMKKEFSSSNALFIAYKISENQGITGFYRGYIPAIVKIIIGNAVTFGVYEKSKIFLEQKKLFN